MKKSEVHERNRLNDMRELMREKLKTGDISWNADLGCFYDYRTGHRVKQPYADILAELQIQRR